MNHLTGHSKQGYILLYTLLTIASLTTIATYMIMRSSVFIPFARTMETKEKAALIARNGIQIALAQLAQTDYESKEKQDSDTGNTKAENTQTDIQAKPKETAEAQSQRLFLTDFVPTMNRWQTYNFKKEIDGIDATLRICLMTEEGKININEIYDYKNKKFMPIKGVAQGWELLLQNFFTIIEQKTGGKDLFKSLSEFLKKQPKKLNDVTELLRIKEFEIFKNRQFYQPPEHMRSEKDKTKKQNPLFLTDLFTVYTNKKTINPLFFSNSLLIMLSLPDAHYNDIKERKKNINKWLTTFKTSGTSKIDWNALFEQLFKKKLNTLPKNSESLFDTAMSPRIFSLISEAKVGTITQRFFAIVEKIKKTDKKKIQYSVQIKKLYWL